MNQLAKMAVVLVAIGSMHSIGWAQAKDAWPMYRGNGLGTGVANSTLPKNPQLLWKYEVKEGAFDATPAIVDGVVYIGDLDGTFYAFDLKQGGEPKWTYKVKDSGFPGSAAIKDGLAYIGDYYGVLHCVDIKTGKKKWTYEANAEINGSPNFFKDQVLFGSQDANLYCLNAKTGKLEWNLMIQDQIQSAPTIVDGKCFLAGCDGKLHIVDVNRGEEISSVGINDPTTVTPAALGDNIYFGTEGGVLFSVNWRKSEVNWYYEDAKSFQSIRSSPAVTKKGVIFGSRSRKVYCVHPETGKLIWKQPVRRNVDASVVISGDRAYVGVTDGRLLAFNIEDGSLEWQYQGRGAFNESPAIAENKLVIASGDGIVYCFGKKDK